jgi:HK97 family phage major capsid protein
MMHDLVLAYARKLAVGNADANPLWQASFRDGEPDRLLGYPVYVNNDMDSAITAAKKIMLFADFSKYKVRRVGGITLKRLNELYAANLVIGFISHLRLDGQLVATGAAKHLITAAA